jgi:hypothetical protein
MSVTTPANHHKLLLIFIHGFKGDDHTFKVCFIIKPSLKLHGYAISYIKKLGFPGTSSVCANIHHRERRSGTNNLSSI